MVPFHMVKHPTLQKENWIDSWGSKDWEIGLAELVTYNLDTQSSDHSPIMLEMQDRNKGVRYKPRTRSHMHYEDMWSTYDECKRIVMDEWGRHDGWVRNKLCNILERQRTTQCTVVKMR